ncbi:Ig-like domain-containing protein [Hymenobacter metallilatus]|uniref:T9SS C-terminal target domain-containing protein n=1 Tax=Hymenobacter metallilatus TaxID=2493666 RepID=A0A428JD71_9BACT|nr:T9SS type A sorting domain-containing protein [Hymenobacter metallilatus]RSK30194.1 T9SS C-terminal target domain-containing protein [Hymenobacter metallilatus]
MPTPLLFSSGHRAWERNRAWQRRTLAACLLLLSASGAWAQTVKTLPGDYPTLAAAITDLNTNGVPAGGLTLNIAAGYTETAVNLTLTATGTSTSPIVFQKSGSGANPLLTAGTGTSTTVSPATTDAVIRLSGSDYVTFNGIDVAESSANTTATTQMEFGYALYRASATDGCQNNTIRNCVVTLNKTNTATIGIAGLSYTTANTTAVAATSTAGANSGNKVYGNVVTNSLTGINFAAASTTALANYDQNNEIGVTAPNTIGNFGGTASGWGAGGNYQNGLKISGNIINSTLNYTSATASTPVAASTVTSTIRGIYGNTGTSSNIDIVNNTITLASGATTSQMSGIENGIGSTAASNTVTITGNTVTNCSYATATTATFYGIYNLASAATVTIAGNTISNNAHGGSASAAAPCQLLYNSGAGTTVTLSNNRVTGNTQAGTSTLNLLFGGSPTSLNITDNQLTGNTKTGGTATSGTLYGIQAGTAAVTATGNTVSNNSIVAAGSSSAIINGYYDFSSPTSEIITGNTFTNLSISGSTTATASSIYGIQTFPTSTTTKTISQNTVGGLALGVTGTVFGISSSSGATVAISRNKLYGLSAANADGIVYGLYLGSGATVTASNNLIGDLTAPAATGTSAVTGLYVAGGTTMNLYFNTVYVNASSSSTTTFGTSGIYVGSTTPTVDLRNNLVANLSVPGATGGATAALRFSAAPGAKLAATSNNNLYYAGAASASRVIYVEGTTTLANAQPTVTAYAAYVGGGRETASVTENPTFLSTTGTNAGFLHLNPAVPNLAESKAQPISGITLDFDGETRNASTPDIGADEGTFVVGGVATDISAAGLASPLAVGCYGASETVAVSIRNSGTQPLDFAATPATITVIVSGAATQTLTATVNTGTLAPGTAQTVTLGTLNMLAVGTYSFAITATVPGDADASNNSITITRTVVGPAAQGQTLTFTGYTGANLSTLYPGWYEATGAAAPAGTTSAWTNATFPAGNTTAKVNLFSTGKNDWVVSPKFLPTASTVLTFSAGLSDYNSTSADPVGMTGTDDFVEVRISTDCGVTFTRIPAFAQFNAGNQPSNGSLTSYSINLGSYAGQPVIVGFFASEGTVDDTPDYDFHIDNVRVNSPQALDMAATALAAPTATQGCYSAAETVSVTVSNVGTQTIDFAVNPATVTAVVTTPGGSQTLTSTINSGTLAAGATQAVALTPTLDMSATGTYSFALTATVQGDQDTSNDALTPAVTRTVVAPVAGTVTASASQLCQSGTSTLTLTGAANGSIQWQQSTDNTTFTDIAGATAATFTTPVLTQTTYFRAQVRCATTATSNAVTITVTNAQVLTTNTPVTICEGTTATLTATATTGNTIRFYEAATGGAPLATGGSFTTPALTASRQYFVEAAAPITNVAGLPSNAATYGTFVQSSLVDYPLGFAVSQAGTLASVDVYPTAAGTLTIRLYSIAGTQPSGTPTAVAGSDVTVTITAAQVGTRVTVPLNYALAPGDYKLSNLAGALGRYSSYSGTYPLSDGALTVKGSYTAYTSTSYSNTTYNSFFNLTFASECLSGRTAIQVNVTAPATAGFGYANASYCTSATGPVAATLASGATAGTFSSTAGLTIDATTGTITPGTSTPGTYTVTNTVAASGGCAAVTATATVTITAPATAGFSYAAASYCTSAPGTVAAALTTGATAGTFSSTTGLTLDASTGAITPGTSTPGTYTVTNTVAASGGCAAVTATFQVTITAPATAGFGYANASYCTSATGPVAATLASGATAGTFSSTAGLTIDATTGTITPGTSTPGTYTVTNTVAASGGCAAVTATATVTITAPATAGFSYAAAAYCVSATGAVAPVLTTGATAGTFSSTTGLTLDASTGAITPSTSTPGTYTVTNTVAASGGCAAVTATFQVTISSAPVASFSYANASYCQVTSGSAAPVLGAGATAGTFSSSTGLVLNAGTGVINLATSTPGTYTVTNTVAASGGCAATSAMFSVTINARPAQPTITIRYNGAVTTLTSSAATGNQWYLNNTLIPGATGQDYVVNSAAQYGNYSVVVTNAAGCASLPSALQIVTTTLKPLAGSVLDIFPNPTSGLMTVKLAGYATTTELTVYDAVGKLVHTVTVGGSTAPREIQLNLSALPTGVYMLRARTEGGTDIRRIVRE